MYNRVLRFAPSPNGYLHLGHAYSALLNYDMAREAGGRLLLRIEDIDTPRARPEYETAIYEDLEWLGISWQQPVRRQSEHFADYESALLKLSALGRGVQAVGAAVQVPVVADLVTTRQDGLHGAGMLVGGVAGHIERGGDLQLGQQPEDPAQTPGRAEAAL